MATIKSHTDLKQSKKLAEILPIESADMHYIIMGDDEDPQSMVGLGEYIGMLPTIPCWSLAALLDIIPYAIHISDNKFYKLRIDKGYNGYSIWYEDNGCTVNTLDVKENNFIDACYKLILKLHGLKIL